MSLFTEIQNAEHSTAAWFEKIWSKIHADAPTIVQIADKTLPYASLVLQTVIGATAGAPAAAVAGSILSKAQSDLDVANALIYDTGATPTAASALAAVQNNLAGLLDASHVKDPKSVSLVAKVVSELGVLIAAFNQPHADIPPAATIKA